MTHELGGHMLGTALQIDRTTELWGVLRENVSNHLIKDHHSSGTCTRTMCPKRLQARQILILTYDS